MPNPPPIGLRPFFRKFRKQDGLEKALPDKENPAFAKREKGTMHGTFRIRTEAPHPRRSLF